MTPTPVAQLIDGFATEEHSGGAALFAIQLARRLPRDRWEPHIIGLWAYNTRSERRWLELLRDEGIATAILVDAPRTLPIDLLKATALLDTYLHDTGSALLNSHFERGDLLATMLRLRRPAGPRIVRTQHTEQQWQTRPWLGFTLNLLAFPRLFDAEVAISAATRQAMDARPAARLLGRRAALLYNGIRAELLERPEPTPALQQRAPRIMIVGRLEAQKGHAYFLRACAAVHREREDVEFWVVGAGPLLQPMVELAAELGLGDAVQFLGQRGDVPDLLRQVDLLVSSSLWEGFPTVILEAMAARLPVVATDVSGSRELVRDGETGLLVAPADAPALARAMLRVLGNPQWARRLGMQAFRAAEPFTIERTAQGYERLYSSILDAHARLGNS